MFKGTLEKEQSMPLNLLITFFQEWVDSKTCKGTFLVLIFKLYFRLLKIAILEFFNKKIINKLALIVLWVFKA